MSDKQEMIKKLLEMQKKFIEHEHKDGVSMEEYFTPSDDSPLKGYRQEYRDLAMKLVDTAHEDRGSHR
ncbi:MAG: hypothetical protein GY807_05530 [Gammaproteobacteria bacterium]|nr:hypothetical protein [Gammaproteobacteria bacterium]